MLFRVTIRWGERASRYEMVDVEAASLREALLAAAERVGAEVDATADLAEVRRLVEREGREDATA